MKNFFSRILGQKHQSSSKDFEHLSAFIKYCPFGVAMFDHELNFIAVSDSWDSENNLDTQQLIGKNIYQIYPNLSDKWREIHRRCLKGEKFSNEEELIERTDGKSNWVRWRMRPWENSEGRIGGILIFFESISDKKKSEEERSKIKATAAKEVDDLKKALDQSTIVAFTNAGGQIIYVNDKFCEISQYSREELIGKTHALVNSSYHSREFFKDMWKTISSGRVWSGEIKNRAKDGSYYWVFTTIIPFLNEMGRPYQYVAIRTDITEQKNLTEEKGRIVLNMQAALETSRLKSEFLATVSHEIRTPINGVIGMTDLLLDTPLNPEQKDFAETIKTSAHDLLTVINDILDFSKVEAGRLNIELVPFSISEMLIDLEKIYRHQAKLRGIEFEVDAGELMSHFALGDMVRIRQVLNNLLSNAVKFTQKGKVRLKVTEKIGASTSGFYFEVADTGIGIESDVAERLFQPFTQADPSTNRKYGGTGLGLSISRKLVELMKGRIGFKANLPQGSLFWFEIELATLKNDKNFIQDSNQVRYEILDGNFKILVAEDNLINLKLTIEMLRRMGVQAESAINGAEVLKRLEQESFDLILMDCQMPEMDGFQATMHIRSHAQEKVRHIPIIALTANALSYDREKCISYGMNDYLSKPVAPDLLHHTLSSWLHHKEKMPAATAHQDVLTVSIDKIKKLYGINDPSSSTLFLELVEMFRQSAPQQISEMKKLMGCGDFSALQRLSHRLKSSGASLGALKFSSLCQELEKSASESDAKECVEKLDLLQREYDQTISELDFISTR